MNPLFRIKNLSAAYSDRTILQNINLQIHEQEICGLLGLNGSGKSTLLLAMCGFIPMQGECFVKESCCTHWNERKRAQHISFIPQICALESGKSALEVVLMGYNAVLNLFEMPSAQQKEQAFHVLEKLGCANLAEQDFAELSQGQRQMIILARCLVQNTPVMLMDEPDSALDFLNKHIILEKIKTIVQTERKAGLITMHDPNFAMAYCDRIFLLKDGGIVDEIDMRTDSQQAICHKLQKIYGEIVLLPNGNSYLMGKKRD